MSRAGHSDFDCPGLLDGMCLGDDGSSRFENSGGDGGEEGNSHGEGAVC